MKFSTIEQHLEGIPYILPSLAREIYHFIIETRPQNCLELGFAHGVSSCYIAAALDEIGEGHLTSVDLLGAQEWQDPTIEELLKKTGLGEYVTVEREHSGYNWFLQKRIYENSSNNRCSPIYDFCFLDGAKNWTIDSSAFFLIDKLLKEDGWLLLDDLQWTYQSKLDEGKTKSDGIQLNTLAADELMRPHLELIYQLLIMQHPDYSNFFVRDYWWAWAQKSKNGTKEVKMEVSDRCRELVKKWEDKHGRAYRLPFAPYGDNTGRQG